MRRRALIGLLMIASLALVLSGCFSLLGPQIGEVRGTVTHEDESPIVGATVQVGGKETTTDAVGAFAVDGIRQGRRMLKVLLGGEVVATQEVIVGPEPVQVAIVVDDSEPGPDPYGNLLENPSFEILGEADQPPPGWRIFRGYVPANMWVEKGTAAHGEYALVIDTHGEANSGMRNEPIPAMPGELFEATAKVLTQAGSKSVLYIEYWDADRKAIPGVGEGTERVTSSGVGGEWETLTVSLVAPEGAAFVSLYFYANAQQAPDPVYWDDAVLRRLPTEV